MTGSSGPGVGLSTDLATPTSAEGSPFTVAAAVSLLVSGSGSLPVVFVAMLVMAPDCVTMAVSVSCALSSTPSRPMDHSPAGDDKYMPWVADAPVSTRPGGNRSTTVTFVATFGPLLTASIVKVTVSPIATVVGDACLLSAMSASRFTWVSASAALLVGSGSVVVLLTCARFRIGLGAAYPSGTANVAMMVRVSPGAIAPRHRGTPWCKRRCWTRT